MKSGINNASDFVTVDEAARLVGLSHWTVRSWLHKGLLTRYKSGSRTVVSRLELLERVRPFASDRRRASAYSRAAASLAGGIANARRTRASRVWE
jgi:excisionase family DNA binding protein